MSHFLGLDSSTQSLTGIVLDSDTMSVVAECQVVFGERLPQYGCPHGFLEHDDPRIRHSDPLMWVEALEVLLVELRTAGIDFATIAGVSGAGQQHGSVYLRRAIDGWSTSASLVEQVQPLLSRRTAPIWMDSSTTVECREIADAIGGDERLLERTGSRATERFTGPQIRKFWKEDPGTWEQTAEVHLVSSFLASVLVGKSVPVDLGDAAGMNLLDLRTGRWDEGLLLATAPGLADRLRPAVASETVVGEVADLFVHRYGFRVGTPVVAFTGDNPSSLVGMGAIAPGAMVVSLGTSDTVFVAMNDVHTDPRGFGNVFGNPAGGFLGLACFANGSLARDRIRRRMRLGWAQFARAVLEQTTPGNGGNFLLPYFVPEITPRVLQPTEIWRGTEPFVRGEDPSAAVRAVVEAQAVSMRHHTRWMGASTGPVLVTGGASVNPGVLRVLADVFQASMVPLVVSCSSAMGAALRAMHAFERTSWDDLFGAFVRPDTERTMDPDPRAVAAYEELSRRLLSEIDAVTETDIRP